MTDPAVDPEISRRGLYAKIACVCGTIVAILAGLPVISFVLAPIFRKPPRLWRAVKRVEEVGVGQTVEVAFEDPSPLPWAGVTARTGAWLRRTSEIEFEAFSINCRHLGCPVRWLENAELFMCPCHGGVYYKDGTVAAGPPPEALARYPVRVRDGIVEIETSAIPLTQFRQST
jgi:menaquinol-cytochrome c reductase iron-sulfur subunit